MGLPAAKQMDKVVGVDIHIVMIPSPGGPIPTPLPSPFNGMLMGNLSTTVKIMGRPAAVVGSTAKRVAAFRARVTSVSTDSGTDWTGVSAGASGDAPSGERPAWLLCSDMNLHSSAVALRCYRIQR